MPSHSPVDTAPVPGSGRTRSATKRRPIMSWLVVRPDGSEADQSRAHHKRCSDWSASRGMRGAGICGRHSTAWRDHGTPYGAGLAPAFGAAVPTKPLKTMCRQELMGRQCHAFILPFPLLPFQGAAKHHLQKSHTSLDSLKVCPLSLQGQHSKDSARFF